MADLVRVERREKGVAWVTIDRAEAMNALSGAVLEGLCVAAQSLRTDRSSCLVVLTGAGEKAFCAGADLKERREMTEEQARARVDLIGHACSLWSRLPRPTVAAINGVALGGGLELALACDFRIAARQAQLGLTEVRLGIIPGAGGTQRLSRLVGVARAKELVLLGRRIDATRAHEIGLVNEVVAPEELEAAAMRLADELAGCAPISVAKAKEAIDRGIDVIIDEGLRIERACYDVTLTTEDRNEGLRAFAEKRPPRFQGK
ncbi:MAG: enoyl-CoA hydratase/isomerase family protein [Deltaproteobacteria bacterium]|nr:enoyl-CoA hydratase/isomerase family protein [Deltaproteobacteria bacterium]